MKQIPLGVSDLKVSRLAYGCMRLAQNWDPSRVDQNVIEQGIRMLEAADEVGFAFFDHADIYCRGACERIYGEALKRHPEWKRRHVVVTKCGIRFAGDPHPDSPHRYDFSKAHILASAEASLRRLNRDCIDLYQLHRPDVLMDPDEVAEAMDALHRSGKVRWFGVSNFLPSQVRALASRLNQPLIVNQVEIHLLRLDPFTDGTLDQCLELKMTPLSWSPVAQGRLTSSHDPGPHPLTRSLHAALDRVAQEHGVSRAEVAIAWLLTHPSGIIPIIGTTQLERIRRSVDALQVTLDRETWYRLYTVARGAALP
jgi:predicted oxidoreductase